VGDRDLPVGRTHVVLRHEMAHQLSDVVMPDQPHWFAGDCAVSRDRTPIGRRRVGRGREFMQTLRVVRAAIRVPLSRCSTGRMDRLQLQG